MKCSVDSSPPAERASRTKTLPSPSRGQQPLTMPAEGAVLEAGLIQLHIEKTSETGGWWPAARKPTGGSVTIRRDQYLALQPPLGRNRRTTYGAIHRREDRRKLAQHLFGHDPPSRMSCRTLALQPTGLLSFLLAHMGSSLLFHRSVSSSGQAHMIGVIYLRKV